MKTDEELMKLALDGDDQALEELIERYLQMVYRFVYHFAGNSADAEDISQQGQQIVQRLLLLLQKLPTELLI